MSDIMTTDAFDAGTTLNEIVRRFPTTTAVFARHGLDACCGGARPLGEAAARHGIDADELMAALRAAVEGR